MFRIAPVQTEKERQKTAREANILLREDSFLYAMRDCESGALLGLSQFDIREESGEILDLVPAPAVDDFEAMFILGRATMDFIDRTGAHRCTALPEGADERLLRAIGFRPAEGGTLTCDMTGMFDGHCGGHALDLSSLQSSTEPSEP